MAYTVNLHYPEASSGTYELFEPDSTTRVTAFADYFATAPLSAANQTLTAVGRATFYVRDVVEIVVKTTSGVEFDRYIESQRAELVDVVNAGFTGTRASGGQGTGGRTNTDRVLTSAFVSLGGLDFKGVNGRYYKDIIGERAISLYDMPGAGGTPAVGDGVADDTIALQQWIDFLGGPSGGATGLLPAGTFRITAPLSMTMPNITIVGVGQGVSQILNTTDTHAIQINITGSANITLRDFTITHETTLAKGFFTSAIEVTSGDYVTCLDMTADRHFRGFGMGAGNNFNRCYRCTINESDNQIFSQGIELSKDGVAEDCVASTILGIGFRCSGARSVLRGCVVVPAAADTSQGIEFAGDDTTGFFCHIRGCNQGIVHGSSARSGAVGCHVTGSTVADYETSAGNTEITDRWNDIGTRIQLEASGHWSFQKRGIVRAKYFQSIAVAGNQTFTPRPELGSLQVVVADLGDTNVLTVGNTTTVGLIDGQEMFVVVQANTGGGFIDWAFDTQYVGDLPTKPPLGSLGVGDAIITRFRWRSSSADWFAFRGAASPGDPIWLA